MSEISALNESLGKAIRQREAELQRVMGRELQSWNEHWQQSVGSELATTWNAMVQMLNRHRQETNWRLEKMHSEVARKQWVWLAGALLMVVSSCLISLVGMTHLLDMRLAGKAEELLALKAQLVEQNRNLESLKQVGITMQANEQGYWLELGAQWRVLGKGAWAEGETISLELR